MRIDAPGSVGSHPALDAPPAPAAETVVGRCWAGMYVGQALAVTPDRRYVAYYDPERVLCVAQETGGGWETKKLDTRLGWDSHNHVVAAVAPDGSLHVAGNMHNDPLTYFTSTDGDVAGLRRVTTMTGPATERSVTYPQFLTTADGTLHFTYRDGGSGRGSTYVTAYDPATRAWRRALPAPLFDGGTAFSAYHQGPVAGPDGRFHLCWVWRATPDAATCSLLTYARSADLVHWETASGQPLPAPFRRGGGDVVEATPEGGGLLNGNARLGFDHAGRVQILFHRYDHQGHSQLYVARPAATGWTVRQITAWTGRWDIGGHGTLVFDVDVRGTRLLPGRLLAHEARVHGETWTVVTGDDLTPVAHVRGGAAEPVRGDWPGLEVNIEPSGTPGHALRWESLPSNQDRPRDEWPIGGSELSIVTWKGGILPVSH